MTRLLVIASALVSAIALFPLGCAWHAVQVDVAGAGGAGAAPAEVYAPSPLAIEDRMWKWGNTPCEINAPDDGPVKIMLHRGGQVVWHTVQPSDERCSVSFVGARAPDLEVTNGGGVVRVARASRSCPTLEIADMTSR